VQTCTCISVLGACGGILTFLVGLIRPTVEWSAQVLRTWLGEGARNFSNSTLLLVLLPFIIPLTWIRSFKSLAFASVRLILLSSLVSSLIIVILC
jgi:hypothetical protein